MVRTRNVAVASLAAVQDVGVDTGLSPAARWESEPPKMKKAPRKVKDQDKENGAPPEATQATTRGPGAAAESLPADTSPPKRGKRARKALVAETKDEAVYEEVGATVKEEASGEAVSVEVKKKPRNRRKSVAPQDGEKGEEAVVPVQKKAANRARKSVKVEVKTEELLAVEISVDGAAEVVAEKYTRKKVVRKKKEPDPLPFDDPTPELLAGLKGMLPGPRPIPNLGYACLNCDLRELKPPVYTSRDLIKRTLDEKGLPYLGQLCLANCQDLARMIQWNQEHGIRFFRMSSVLWPWMGTFDPKQLPQYEEIGNVLAFAGQLARAYDQRLTFHPSHFVKLGSPDDALTQKSMNELEGHAQILDLMGYDPPSVWNKVNIHVGGTYGDKQATMERWAAAYMRLSPSCRQRVTVENDDRPNAYSVRDLLELHRLCGVPIVFDFHHWRFCKGDMTQEEALRAAIATWPEGIRPVVHWSESQEGRIPHAHSDYVRGPMNLYGLEAEVDVMIEAKAKERSLLCFRDGLPIPDVEIPSKDPGAGKLAKAAAPFLDD